MTNSIQSTHRSIAVLSVPKKVSALISYAENVVQRMTDSPHFSSPAPTLAVVTAAISDLQAAEAAALSGLKGAAVTRNGKRNALAVILQQLRSYVQLVADAAGDSGLEIIESAGFAVRKQPVRKPRVFAAKPGPSSGVATVIAATSAHRASYEWEYSTDGGKTWVESPPTLQAKTTIADLVPGSTVQFRYRGVTRTGAADWSAPVSLTIP
jgi:hypothetical protein